MIELALRRSFIKIQLNLKLVKILHMNQEQTAMELTDDCGLDKSNISHENFQSNVGKIELKLV
jgi:hypothetical protein